MDPNVELKIDCFVNYCFIDEIPICIATTSDQNYKLTIGEKFDKFFEIVRGVLLILCGHIYCQTLSDYPSIAIHTSSSSSSQLK